MPTGLFLFYRAWMRKTNKTRTQVFYIWGVSSCCLMFFIFQMFVIPYREILLWENLLLSTMFGLMMYSLYFARGDPGNLPKGHPEDGLNNEVMNSDLERINKDFLETPFASALINNFGFDEGVMKENVAVKAKHFKEREEMPLSQEDVVWVDSRPIVGSYLAQISKIFFLLYIQKYIIILMLAYKAKKINHMFLRHRPCHLQGLTLKIFIPFPLFTLKNHLYITNYQFKLAVICSILFNFGWLVDKQLVAAHT